MPVNVVCPSAGRRAGREAYAVAHAEGAQAPYIAIDWMRQMSDNALHLDDYDSALLDLG